MDSASPNELVRRRVEVGAHDFSFWIGRPRLNMRISNSNKTYYSAERNKLRNSILCKKVQGPSRGAAPHNPFHLALSGRDIDHLDRNPSLLELINATTS